MATRWLQPGDSNGEQRMLGQIVLEQFMEGLPTGTAEWVRCHRPTDLDAAITFAEDHLDVFSQGRTPEAQPASLSCPTPAPQRRLSIADSLQQHDHLLSPALKFPVISFHPRFQPLQVLLPTRRGSLRWRCRSVGGARSTVIFAHLWRSDR